MQQERSKLNSRKNCLTVEGWNVGVKLETMRAGSEGGSEDFPRWQGLVGHCPGVTAPS